MARRSDGLATRERVLVAAAALVARDGPLALTLDGAAEAAELSKGAVLYHFKTKDALIEALMRSVLDRFDAMTEAAALKDADRPGAFSRAYVRVAFDPRSNTREASSGLLAAITNNIALLKPAAERHASIQHRLENDGISPAVATLIRLTVDGLYFARAFGLAPPSIAKTAQLQKLLLQLILDDSDRNR
jgi:AcrR family transcriptional regulator